MKIKVINRIEEDFTRARAQDLRKVHKNLDPALHPFEKAVEYKRAETAAKLDRIFAKPFIAAFPHDDGITCLARSPTQLNCIVAGCADGVLCVWDIPARRCLRRLIGHTGAVNGVSFAPSGDVCVTAGVDATARLYRVPYAPFQVGNVMRDEEAVHDFHGQSAFSGVDHHWSRNVFATAGAQSGSNKLLQVGVDTITSVRFNPAEPDLFASTASDRSVVLYDLRAATPLRKFVMQTKTNALAWNPMEAINFTTANEDHNLYTYDLRKLTSASCVHKDFTSAVMDVDYSPTGREIVAGSYDRSVRIFPYNGGHSREVYTTKRMQRVFAVRFSGDATYVFSGSDDMNLRVWKANASEQLGTLLPREKHKQAYQKALVQRYSHLPVVKSIARHRHLPAPLYKAGKKKREMEDAERRRKQNQLRHLPPDKQKPKSERRRKLLAEQE